MTIRSFLRCSAAVVLGGMMSLAQAAGVSLYVDAAPNKYGSPNYAAWETVAKQAASNGTFVNMGNSADAANAGTTQAEIEDLVVYSFGDLGSRLTWVYWIPNTNVAALAGRVQVALDYDWDGVNYDAYFDYYGATWLTPTSLVDFNGGVIGMAGWAWWGAYNTNTQAELDADLAAWGPSQGDLNFQVRILDNAGAVQSLDNLTVQVNGVPEPTTLALVAAALIGAGVVRRRRA